MSSKTLLSTDETVIFCTCQHSIFDEVDEYDETGCYLVINHDGHCVIDDAHKTVVRTVIAAFATSCEGSGASPNIICRAI
jgi:hypothetical protein